MTYESSINEDQIRDKVSNSDNTATEPIVISSTSGSSSSNSGFDTLNNESNEDASKVEECLDDKDDPICSTSSSLDHCDDLTVATDLLEAQKKHKENNEQYNNIDTNTSIENRKLSVPNELHFISKLDNNIEVDNDKEENLVCYNKDLDDEIRNRLDKLNSLSDLINSLERQFDEANRVFREILKCSTDRLSTIAKTLGNKSIRQGRIYNATKLSVEQSQDDCQKACVQFEQANKEHQIAKKAIQEAELRLREVTKLKSSTLFSTTNDVIPDESNLEFNNLKLDNTDDVCSITNCSTPTILCDNNTTTTSSLIKTDQLNSFNKLSSNTEQDVFNKPNEQVEAVSPTTSMINNASKLSEELNQAIQRLVEAERRRGISEREHLDRANKLMVDQEKLVKLEREHGQSIKRSLLYFDEARRFNDKLKTIKDDIDTITRNIIAAKQAYAQTLCELEQFSDDLHLNSMKAEIENNNEEPVEKEL